MRYSVFDKIFVILLSILSLTSEAQDYWKFPQEDQVLSVMADEDGDLHVLTNTEIEDSDLVANSVYRIDGFGEVQEQYILDSSYHNIQSKIVHFDNKVVASTVNVGIDSSYLTLHLFDPDIQKFRFWKRIFFENAVPFIISDPSRISSFEKQNGHVVIAFLMQNYIYHFEFDEHNKLVRTWNYQEVAGIALLDLFEFQNRVLYNLFSFGIAVVDPDSIVTPRFLELVFTNGSGSSIQIKDFIATSDTSILYIGRAGNVSSDPPMLEGFFKFVAPYTIPNFASIDSCIDQTHCNTYQYQIEDWVDEAQQTQTSTFGGHGFLLKDKNAIYAMNSQAAGPELLADIFLYRVDEQGRLLQKYTLANGTQLYGYDFLQDDEYLYVVGTTKQDGADPEVDGLLIRVDKEFLYSSVQDPIVSTPFTITPNPSSGLITVSGLPMSGALRVYDLLGKMLYNTPIDSDMMSIDLSHLPEATYIVSVHNERQSTSQKVVVQR